MTIDFSNRSDDKFDWLAILSIIDENVDTFRVGIF